MQIDTSLFSCHSKVGPSELYSNFLKIVFEFFSVEKAPETAFHTLGITEALGVPFSQAAVPCLKQSWIFGLITHRVAWRFSSHFIVFESFIQRHNSTHESFFTNRHRWQIGNNSENLRISLGWGSAWIVLSLWVESFVKEGEVFSSAPWCEW